jgi:hypothetical protein
MNQTSLLFKLKNGYLKQYANNQQYGLAAGKEARGWSIIALVLFI